MWNWKVSFHLCGQTVYRSKCAFAEMKSVLMVFLPPLPHLQYLKVMGCYEKYPDILLSDFNSSLAELIPRFFLLHKRIFETLYPLSVLFFPVASFSPFNTCSLLLDSFIIPNGCDWLLTSLLLMKNAPVLHFQIVPKVYQLLAWVYEAWECSKQGLKV